MCEINYDNVSAEGGKQKVLDDLYCLRNLYT